MSEDKILPWSNWFFLVDSMKIKVKKETQSYLINCEPIVSATSISLLNRWTNNISKRTKNTAITLIRF
ncbi:hypothetical protein OAQ51_04745 [Gammaproteobacteria bacterium]|nr:hypothetical protein [Gammaproteobacteria bacterium]